MSDYQIVVDSKNLVVLTDAEQFRLNSAEYKEREDSFYSQLRNHKNYIAYSVNMSNTCSSKILKGSDIGIETEKVTKTIKVSSVDDFIEFVVNQKRTWSPYLFDGFGKEKVNSTHSQMIVLDFDNGVKYQRVLDVCQEFDIMPTLIYTTFSHTEYKHKFRVIWCLKHILKMSNLYMTSDLQYYQSIEAAFCKIMNTKLLQEVMPKTDGSMPNEVYDKQCIKDIQRKYYSGIEVVYRNPENDLYPAFYYAEKVAEHIISLDGDRTRGADGLIQYSNTVYNDGKELRKSQFSFEQLAKTFKIFGDFYYGKRWLEDDELYGIASNLVYLEGGAKYYQKQIQHLQDIGVSKYDSNKLRDKLNKTKTASINKKKGNAPKSLANFSPYYEDHIYNNMIENCRQNNYIVPKINENHNINYCHKTAIDNVRIEMSDAFINVSESFLNGTHKKVNLLVNDCGLGKSHSGMQFAGASFGNFGLTTAFYMPRYDLIKEKYDKALIEDDFKHCNFVQQPKKPAFSTNLENSINQLYDNKEFKKVRGLIMSVAESTKFDDIQNNIQNTDILDTQIGLGLKFTANDVLLAREYLNDLILFESADEDKQSDVVMLATHKKFINKRCQKHIHIVDECLEKASINQNTVNFRVLDYVETLLPDNWKSEYRIFINKLKALVENRQSFTSNFSQFEEHTTLFKKCKGVCRKADDKKLFELFDCDSFTISKTDETYYFNSLEYRVPLLSDDEVLIVMSATPNYDFYYKMFGKENVNIIKQQTFVRPQAQIIQNSRFTFSKSSLFLNEEKNKNRIEMLDKFLKFVNLKKDDNYLITFKGFEINKEFELFKSCFDKIGSNQFLNGHSCHYGGIDGFDGLKYKDTIIFGTYSINPDALKRKTLALYPYIDIQNLNDDKMRMQKCSDEDFIEFSYNTYSVEEHKKQHLQFIRDAQVQAVYRSRPLTAPEDCKIVCLFKYPIKGSIRTNRI